MNYKTVHEKKDNQLEVLTCHWTCQETVVQTLVTFSVSTGCIYRGRKCDILDLDWPVISVLISALYICSTWADRWKTSVKPAPRGHFLCTFCLYSLFVSQVELFLHLKASCAEGLLFPMSRCAGVKGRFAPNIQNTYFECYLSIENVLLRFFFSFGDIVSRDVCLLVPPPKK